MPQSGKICATECPTKAGLCRRLSRRVNMIARKNPVTAPRQASVTERPLNVRRPWLVRMNPVYAMAAVQRIRRSENMGDHLSMTKYCHNSPCGGRVSAVCQKNGANGALARLGIPLGFSRGGRPHMSCARDGGATVSCTFVTVTVDGRSLRF